MKDGKTLRLVRSGRTREADGSFEEYYRASYPLVYNYVFRRVLQHESAEDIVAEAFLRAARYYGRFDPSRAKFSTWVISIARNCINDHFNRQAPTAPLDDLPESAFATHDDVGEGVGDRELAARLLARLEDDERELVYLKYYEGRRNVDIARIMGVNPSTVSTRLARSLEKMRAAAS